VHFANRDGSGWQNLEKPVDYYAHRLAWSSRGTLLMSDVGGVFYVFNPLKSIH
jgi:hypothetical protein